jgi:CheY-like chemotaxis protein
MFNGQTDHVEILGVCIEPPRRLGRVEGIGFHAASSARRAADLLRMLSFNLILVGTRLPDMSTWDFLRHLRVAYPHQKLALVGGPLTEQQQNTARLFGANFVFDGTPSTHELLAVNAHLHNQAVASVLNGRF